MKRIIKYISILLSGAVLLTGCSKDYLDTLPSDSASPTTVFESVDNAAQAIGGICQMMMTQHQYYGQGFNGEGTIKMMYGEYPGNDFSFPQFAPGWSPIMNQEFHLNTNSMYLHYPWYYYYILISNANSIVMHIDEAAGLESERQFIKAQGLTIRAFAYTQLVQFYCYRWSDSNNGASDGVVLRLDESTGSIPISTLGEVYKQIYDDLDEAIRLYTESGQKRTAFWQPDLSVAYAVYARAALNREDYATAQTMAPKAYAEHPLMSNKDYYAGFCIPNDEWIWGAYNDAQENIYYYTFGVTMGYNGFYAANTPYCVIANRELIDQFPDRDIRKGLFFHQNLFPDYDFTDVKLVSQSMGNVQDENAVEKPTAEAKALRKAMSKYANENAAYKPGYDDALYSIYGHIKFAVTGQPGVSNLVHFRSSEMYLIEAEAAYHNNDIKAAQDAMIALNKTSGRDTEYTCTKTGEELLKEIKLYRRLELWGEGFSWYDSKRWNEPLSRKSFANGGTFNASVSVTITPDAANKWTWDIPLRESDYNDAIK